MTRQQTRLQQWQVLTSAQIFQLLKIKADIYHTCSDFRAKLAFLKWAWAILRYWLRIQLAISIALNLFAPKNECYLTYYNPFSSYAHPAIVRDHANVHKIGSHIPMVADRYPWISPSCGFDIVATALVGKKYYFVSKNSRSEYYYHRIYFISDHLFIFNKQRLWFMQQRFCLQLLIWW